MIIHVYTMVHNEEVLMPYFMKHYSLFASKITVLDNESEDWTADIARLMGAEIIPIDTGGKHMVSILMLEMNERYKASRGVADWVICAEGDEFLWHPDLPGLLQRYLKLGITVPRIQGFDMVSVNPPKGTGQIYEEIQHGFHNILYGKRAIFSPMVDIRFDRGGHTCHPLGPVVESPLAEIKLLHYRYLGEEYFERRYAEHRKRLSAESILRNFGTECLEDHRSRYRRELQAARGTIVRVVP